MCMYSPQPTVWRLMSFSRNTYSGKPTDFLWFIQMLWLLLLEISTRPLLVYLLIPSVYQITSSNWLNSIPGTLGSWTGSVLIDLISLTFKCLLSWDLPTITPYLLDQQLRLHLKRIQYAMSRRSSLVPATGEILDHG